MLGGPAAARLGAVVVGPDQLVEEALAAEQLVEQQLAVVRLAVVDVEVQRALGREQPAHLAQARLEEAEVVVERVAVGGLLAAAAWRSGGRRSRCGRRRRPATVASVRRVCSPPGVERRVEVGERRAAVRLGAQQRQVVAEQDPVHAGERIRAGGGGTEGASPSLCAAAAASVMRP